MTISEIYKPGDRCIIRAGWGYTLNNHSEFKRATEDIPCTVYAVQGGLIYVILPNGERAHSNNGAIVPVEP